MVESFFTIAKSVQGLYREKGSKFIAFAHPVADSEQIKGKLEEIKKEYYDARHHCYAWILGPDKSKFKAFDDGEPNHSAGDPILNQIKSKNLTNVLVVVVRYFGGVKLGISGLTTAYKLATHNALESASIIEIMITKRIIIYYSYPETVAIKKLLNEYSLQIIQEEFNEECTVILNVKVSEIGRLTSRIKTLQQQGLRIRIISDD